jgi:hypothetical protein
MISWTQQCQGGTVPRPRTGETPIRHVRVGEELWGQVGDIAREQGKSMTAVVVEALKRHVAAHKRSKRADG